MFRRLAAERIPRFDGAAGTAAVGAGDRGGAAAESAGDRPGIPARGKAGDCRALGCVSQHGDPRRRRPATGLAPYRAARRSPRSRTPRFGSSSTSDSKWSCNPFPGPAGHAVLDGRHRSRVRTGSTDLYGPLATAPAKFKNLVGVVLVSDGDWNAGLPPVEAATLLRLKGVPVLAVPVGKPDRLPDVEVRSLDAPTFAVLGKSVRSPLHDREFPAPRLRDDRDAAHVRRRRGVQRGPHCGHGGHPRLACMEAGGAGRRDADATGSPAAPRRNADGQQSAERAGLGPPGEAAGPGGRVVSPLGIPLSPQRLVARSRRRVVVFVVPSRPEQTRRGKQGLHPAIPRRTGRALPLRRGLPGRRGRGQRPAYRRAVRLVEGTGRAPGERHRFHAGLAGDAALAAEDRAGRALPGRARRRASPTAGDRARPAISPSPSSAGAAS